MEKEQTLDDLRKKRTLGDLENQVIEQIEVDSYHMAVKLAMDLIVTSYDSDQAQWLD